MPVIEEVSTISVKGQTTVPKAVRQILGVEVGGQIAFRVEGRQVTLHSVEAEHEDPAIDRFLEFLASDIERRPDAVRMLSEEFAARMASLAQNKKADLDEPIEGSVDI